MKKIFEELAQEAGVHHINYDEEYSVEFEKFAELLVRECARVVYDEWVPYGDCPPMDKPILKYFGLNNIG